MCFCLLQTSSALLCQLSLECALIVHFIKRNLFANFFGSSQGNFAPQYDVHLVAFFPAKLDLFTGLNHLVRQKLAQVIQIVSVKFFLSLRNVILKVGHLCEYIPQFFSLFTGLLMRLFN